MTAERENEIRNAVSHFESLLREQLERQERMANDSRKLSFADAEHITIGLIDGDGIGPIIMREAIRVMEKLLAREIASGRVNLRRIEGLTIENRIQLGQSVPDDVLAAIKECDVLSVYVYLISTDMLCDSACFACCNVSVSDTVKDRCLTVVNVSHYNYNRAAWFEVCIVVVSIVDKTLLNGNDNFLFYLCAEFLSNQ